MTSLIALLSTGKGSWLRVSEIIDKQDWEQIILVTNEFGKENYTPKKDSEFVVVDFKKPDVITDISRAIKGKIKGFEIGVNISSGTGEEHMILLSALIEAGLAIRFIDKIGDKVEEVCSEKCSL